MAFLNLYREKLRENFEFLRKQNSKKIMCPGVWCQKSSVEIENTLRS
jgi:hypothetical protein